jgi:ABC-type uncharacterized transport system involved in gliding motility auxiliary subunit
MQQTLRRMNRGTLTVIGVALAVLCFLAVNLFSTLQLGAARLDLTENGLYTLSDSTSAMLKGMKEPVKLRLYASRLLLDSNPAIKPYAARVREVLASYVKLSGDRISLEIIDPEPFSPEEDRAAAFGLRGVPYDPTGNRVYFGLVGTNTTDDTDSIPFLAPDREPFLEYDLTRLVYNLAHPAKPVVAVLDGREHQRRAAEQLSAVADLRADAPVLRSAHHGRRHRQVRRRRQGAGHHSSP